MSNYGVEIKGDNKGGEIHNTVTINKNKFAVGLTLTISLIVVLAFFSMKYFISSTGDNTTNILGTWYTVDGEYVEFFSDGTIDTNIHNVSVNPDTYEILEEGYLKWGEYDPSWIQYFYTYWDFNINGNKLTLSSREDETTITLTRE